MAEKSKKSTKNQKDNKNLIIGICAAVAIIVVIIITVVLINGNSLNDSYFVSDGTKYVLTLESDESDTSDPYEPLKTHTVYTYEGDTITSMKTYYVYADAASAKAAFDALKQELGDEAGVMELNGKYIIFPADEESYKDLTASDVKSNIEFIESLKNLNLSEQSNDSSDTEEDVEIEEAEDEE